MDIAMIVNNTALLIISIVFALVPSLWLVFLPFRQQLRFSGRNTALLLLCSTVVVIGLTFFIYRPYQLMPGMRIYFSGALMVLYLWLIIYLIRAPLTLIIFVLFFVKSYTDTITFFHRVLVVQCLPDAANEISPLLYAGLFIGLLAVVLPMMWLFVTKVLQPLLAAGLDHAFVKYLCVMPVIFYILHRFNFSAQYVDAKFIVNGKIIVLHCVWLAMMLLFYYVILKMLTEVVKNAKLAQVLHTSEIQLTMQKEQYKKLQATIETTRHARHDLRQHLLVMKDYAKQKDCVGLQGYIDSCLSTLPSDSEAVLCANIAVNAIVQYYLGLARNQQIAVSAKLSLPEKLVIAETDCCIVLGNLLENAIEACLRQQVGKRFIKVKVIAHTKAAIAISIINSFDHPIREQDGRFLSSKRDNYGIGTASVRSITEKYNGIIRYSYEKGIFSAALLLNEQPN